MSVTAVKLRLMLTLSIGPNELSIVDVSLVAPLLGTSGLPKGPSGLLAITLCTMSLNTAHRSCWRIGDSRARVYGRYPGYTVPPTAPPALEPRAQPERFKGVRASRR